jgi:hypothetical protein
VRRVAPSVLAREDLHRLLSGGADRESNIVSALVEVVTRLSCRSSSKASRQTSWAAAAAASVVERVRPGHVMAMSGAGSARPSGRSRSRCRKPAARPSRSGRR